MTEAGWGPSGGGATLLGRGGEPGLTARFVERAFAFPVPVRVRVEETAGGAVRLALVVVPRYLPAAGAVAVRAAVEYFDPSRRQTESADVAFVVRYERPERGPLRYAVRAGAGWATAVPVATLGGLGSGLDGLAVHVGPGWGALPDGPGGLAGAAGRLVAAGRTPTRSAVYAEDRAGRAAQAALRSSGHVPDAARLDPAATPGLGAALGAGRFTVTGFAVFDPARPLDPAIPEMRPSPNAVVATEEVHGRRGYRHPKDYRPNS